MSPISRAAWGGLLLLALVPLSAQSPPAEPVDARDAQRRQALARLNEAHDATSDPRRRIELDQRMLELLDPLDDFDKIRALRGEIEAHRGEIAASERQGAQAEVVSRARALLAEGGAARARELLASARAADPAAVELRTLWREALLAEARQRIAERELDAARDLIVLGRLELGQDSGLAQLERLIEAEARRRVWRRVVWVVLGLLLAVAVGLLVWLLLRRPRWSLYGVDGVAKGQAFELSSDEIFVGALGPPEGQCTIVLADEERQISRVHCLIFRHGRSWYLQDEGSSNGTALNGRLLTPRAPVPLELGDRLSLAGVAELVVSR